MRDASATGAVYAGEGRGAGTAQPDRHVAHDPHPGGRRVRPFRADGPVLLAAGLGGPHHHRGHAPRPDGAGLHLPARPAHRGAGGGLAEGDRCGPRRRGPHLRPTHARRAGVPLVPAARPRPAGRPLGHRRLRGGPHLRRESAVRDAPPAGDGRNPRRRRRVSPGGGAVDRGGVRRGGTPCGDRLPAEPVPGHGVEPPHRRLRRVAGEPDPLHAGSHRGPVRRAGCGSGRDQGRPRLHRQRHVRRRPRRDVYPPRPAA